jgi:hypothetical protein
MFLSHLLFLVIYVSAGFSCIFPSLLLHPVSISWDGMAFSHTPDPSSVNQNRHCQDHCSWNVFPSPSTITLIQRCIYGDSPPLAGAGSDPEQRRMVVLTESSVNCILDASVEIRGELQDVFALDLHLRLSTVISQLAYL